MAFKRLERLTELRRQLEIIQSQQIEVGKIPQRGAETTKALRKQRIALDIKAALIKGELNSLER